MNLKLERPLAFFDLETTGINIATDKIVEISILKVYPNGDKESITKRVNPGRPIPIEASEVHGIYDKDVADAPFFMDIAPDIERYFENCDLAGYNSNRFDIPLLVEEFLRAGIDINIENRKQVDVQVVFYKNEPRTLTAAYKYYCNKNLDNAHSAEADTNATFEILDAQVAKYDDIQGDVMFLDAYTTQRKTADLAGRFLYNDDKEVVFNFGKHSGKLLKDVLKQEPGYYNWMMKGDFPLYTKKLLQKVKAELENKLF